ncbi:CRISPR-associated protein Csx1 [Anaerobranca californiensis DSM 14826]|jgi:CRISPR-associated protein Csx1|uniref:CRISPR-associated protein Csx1 n=1 Tax=Anaerobranca californiensis DSM 14826 TaxID=1120989 RepID=A0A1M6QKM2_9FIRM|nr:CRISPR-associated CARF protein Csx1 [Anaerobranca californiensis]SHK20660.1 CRISPR-associated protein Csx1 [Anaerobranca californiensis DSM 14826]
MNVIYQVGRFTDYPVNFSINEGEKIFEKKSVLSSFVLRDFFQSQGTKAEAVLFYPVSIVFNMNFSKDKNLPLDIKEELNKTFENPADYLINPEQLIEKMADVYEKERDDFLILHSIGAYLSNIEINGKYSDIVLNVLADMIKRLFDKEVKAFYIDISSGLNFYISAMLEAARHFSVFANLFYWGERDKIPSIYIVFTDPIFNNKVEKYNIYKEKQNFLAFFNSPINKEETIKNFSFVKDGIYQEKEMRKKKGSLVKKLDSFTLLYSAIKNDIPLYVLSNLANFHSEEEITEEIKKLVDSIFERNKKFGYNSSLNVDKNSFNKALLSLALYKGIVSLLNRNGIKYSNDEGIEIEKLVEYFKKFYETFNLTGNYKVLNTEIENLKKILENKLDESKYNKWIPLWQLKEPYKSTEVDNRNFFAHSGLERNTVEFKKEKDKLFIRYNLENYALKKEKNTEYSIVEKWLRDNI